MIWLRTNIKRIEDLLANGTPHSTRYAALECRIALEKICYERLRNAHDYISNDDLRRWRPGDVVNDLILQVDQNAATSLTLSMSSDPVSDDENPDDIRDLDYQIIGKQVGFDPHHVSKLWLALSSHLHVRVPKTKDDDFKFNELKAKSKVEECLEELKRLSEGTMIMSGLGETLSFDCFCGSKNKRRLALLSIGDVINCINPQCDEIFRYVNMGEEETFKRESFSITCRQCGSGTTFPKRSFTKMALATVYQFKCEHCGTKNEIRWQLAQAK